MKFSILGNLEPVWLCERKLRIRNGKGKRWKVGDNDERVKFVGPRISVRWREKTCGPRDICK